MIILFLVIAFALGMCVGGYVVYRYEAKTIAELNERCAEANERLTVMIKDEEKFLSTMWPKYNSLGDYMKANRDIRYSDWDDCEDESDNLYV